MTKMTTEEAFVKVLQMHGIELRLELSVQPLCQFQIFFQMQVLLSGM